MRLLHQRIEKRPRKPLAFVRDDAAEMEELQTQLEAKWRTESGAFNPQRFFVPAPPKGCPHGAAAPASGGRYCGDMQGWCLGPGGSGDVNLFITNGGPSFFVARTLI